jgi:DNA mismatch repair protein MutS2
VLDDQVQVLVISGPNTGGKTVTLKIVGLFALMVKTGMHLPCEPESEMAVFPELFADIGDAQDLARDLSSFSAHMTQMVELLKRTYAGRQALVLLDEQVTSTDPIEGGACRSLAAPSRRAGDESQDDALPPLKVLRKRPRIRHASVEFDTATLSRRTGCSWACLAGHRPSRSPGALEWSRPFSTRQGKN